MPARVLSLCGVASVLAALCLAVASSAGASEAEAVADAEARLASIALPPGAIPVGERPDGITLDGPPLAPSSPNFVDRGGWWVLSGSPADVLAWFRANPPGGTTQRISGGGAGPGGAEFSYQGFEWPATAALSWRTAFVAAASRPEGGTALRIDAQAIWLEQHPSSERIPARARFLEVEWSRPNGHDSTASSSNARFVRSVAAELDELPIAQPGVIHCPMLRSDRPTVTLRFRRRVGGPVLSEAGQSLPAGVCSPMSLTIRGSSQAPLTGAGPVIARLRKLR
jgi:hypothetical protein